MGMKRDKTNRYTGANVIEWLTAHRRKGSPSLSLLINSWIWKIGSGPAWFRRSSELFRLVVGAYREEGSSGIELAFFLGRMAA
jgi:hypothetical protein